MSELRYNAISRDWVIIAKERAKRPEDFKRPKLDNAPLPEHKDDCPFCPGNEGDRTDETFRLSDGKAWKTRAIFNKYPALSPGEDEERWMNGLYSHMDGFGFHEVIVENPRHNTIIALMSDEEAENIIKTYKSRYVSIEAERGVRAITIFKNHGLSAGCSLAHPHSQLVATPIVPPQIRSRMEQAARYFDIAGKCIFCYTLKQELEAKERMVFETENFVSFIPYAAPVPFAIWIFPRRHAASFDEITEPETRDLAKHLKTVLSKLYRGLDNPDFNYTIRSIPVREKGVEYFHWYISVIPRINQPAGFELGSGIFINVSLPEDGAKFLRDLK